MRKVSMDDDYICADVLAIEELLIERRYIKSIGERRAVNVYRRGAFQIDVHGAIHKECCAICNMFLVISIPRISPWTDNFTNNRDVFFAITGIDLIQLKKNLKGYEQYLTDLAVQCYTNKLQPTYITFYTSINVDAVLEEGIFPSDVVVNNDVNRSIEL